MSTESWFEVQAAEAEENALVGDLIERGMKVISEGQAILEAFERVAEQGISKGLLDQFDELTGLVEQASQRTEELK